MMERRDMFGKVGLLRIIRCFNVNEVLQRRTKRFLELAVIVFSSVRDCDEISGC